MHFSATQPQTSDVERILTQPTWEELGDFYLTRLGADDALVLQKAVQTFRDARYDDDSAKRTLAEEGVVIGTDADGQCTVKVEKHLLDAFSEDRNVTLDVSRQA